MRIATDDSTPGNGGARAPPRKRKAAANEPGRPHAVPVDEGDTLPDAADPLEELRRIAGEPGRVPSPRGPVVEWDSWGADDVASRKESAEASTVHRVMGEGADSAYARPPATRGGGAIRVGGFAAEPKGLVARWQRFTDYVAGPTDTDVDSPPPDVLDVPAIPRGWRQEGFRLLKPGLAAARILENDDTGEVVYQVLEPRLSPDEARVLTFLKETFVRAMDVDVSELDRDGARAYLLRRVRRLVHDYAIPLTREGRTRVEYYVERDFIGFGPMDPMMLDSELEDISCDGPGTPVYVFDRSYESIPTNIVFPNDALLDGFVMELVQKSGKDISMAEPLVDATLPNGDRLQATFSRDVTTRGSTFTVRRYRPDPFTIVDLLRLGTASSEILAYLWLVVESGASAVICGGTASGKTTSLNAMSLLIPTDDKIVSIEDTREINLPHPNWIPGVTRGASFEEEGMPRARSAISMFDLLKAALRQRPEYILFGEIRGREAYVLFQAMATGHTVYSTMHADSAPSAVYRLESKPIEIPRIMLNALDLLVVQGQVRIRGHRVRRMKEIVEVTGIDPVTGDLLTNTVFQWDLKEDKHVYLGKSHTLDKIAELHNTTPAKIDHEWRRRARLIEWMSEAGVESVRDVMRVVGAYRQNPERVLARAGIVDGVSA